MGAAADFAKALHDWAQVNGYWTGFDSTPPQGRASLSSVLPRPAEEDDAKAEALLGRVEMTGILVNDDAATVTVLTSGHLGPRNSKPLPKAAGDVKIEWIGSAQIQAIPTPLPPLSAVKTRCYLHNGRIACGSSITAATIFSAGTMGCLVQDANGDLCGLSNNHVTGGCNHMEIGMPVLSPAPVDATSNGPEPRTIGRHKALIPLDSGNPATVKPQEFDVATFKITDPNGVTSIQGQGAYDTPTVAAHQLGGRRVKKIGRSSGLTTGVVKGGFGHLLPMPYHSPNFNATVYLKDMVGIAGDGGVQFSEPGDSGSLVVTEDGQEAVGLVVGSMGPISIVMPILPVLHKMGLTLVGAHLV